MVSFLIRILMLAGVIWLLRQFMALFMGASKKARSKDNSAGAANHMVKDPICGMYMDSRLAVRLQSGKETVYFCSEECRDKFLSKSACKETGSAEVS
jgi:YHS domain-containing protein